MDEFKPLEAQRAIRDDGDLRSAEKALLWSAVLRTDNSSRKVRASLTTLAKDAGLHRNTATAVFAERNTSVLRYFEKIEREQRKLDLHFYPSGVLVAGSMHSECATAERGAEEGHARQACMACPVGVHGLHSECAPSALSPDSAVQLIRPSSLGEPEDRSATNEGDAAVRPLPCGCLPGVSCPECRGDQPVRSKHSPGKLEQFYNDHLERDEGLGPDGTPLDRQSPSTSYRARSSR